MLLTNQVPGAVECLNPGPISKAFPPLSLRYKVVLIYGTPGKTGRGKTGWVEVTDGEEVKLD